MLRLGNVTIDPHYEPPRPVLHPRRRVIVTRTDPGQEGGDCGPGAEYEEDYGLEPTRIVRFVSSETQGFVTPEQASSLIALYESGGGFELETDLLGQLGSGNVTYAAYFDRDELPAFTPAVPDGSLYYFDIVLRIA